MVPGVIFLPILGETGYRLRVPLRNTSSGQFSHCALPWCNRRSILTSESYKYKDSITFLPFFEFRAIFMTKIDPCTVFSTFDWDQLAKIRQHGWKECLKISEVAKFLSHLFKTNSRLYGGGDGRGGGKFVPPTIQRKNKISQLSGAISSLFLELGKLL